MRPASFNITANHCSKGSLAASWSHLLPKAVLTSQPEQAAHSLIQPLHKTKRTTKKGVRAQGVASCCRLQPCNPTGARGTSTSAVGSPLWVAQGTLATCKPGRFAIAPPICPLLDVGWSACSAVLTPEIFQTPILLRLARPPQPLECPHAHTEPCK